MSDGILKFRELLLTNEEFQAKLKNAVESYDGEKSEEGVFNNILMPIASEYGISATYDEFKAYMEHLASDDVELNTEEIAQVAGGDKGFGINLCAGVGVGIGDSGDCVCAVLGGSTPGGYCSGSTGACAGPGVSV